MSVHQALHQSKRLASLASVLTAAALTLSCETGTTSSSVVAADLEVEFSPSPIPAQQSPDADFEWLASFDVVVTEVNGVGGEIQAVTATLNEVINGVVVDGQEGEQIQLSVDGADTSVEANGSNTLSFDILYGLPGGVREAVVRVVIQLLDDTGFTLVVVAEDDVI